MIICFLPPSAFARSQKPNGIAQRRANGVLSPQEQSIRGEILSGLLADKGGAAQISTAMCVLAEISPKARANPKTLAHLDGYKRPLVSSLSGNLQRFGMDKVSKVESLQEIIAEMTDRGRNGENPLPNNPLPSPNGERNA